MRLRSFRRASAVAAAAILLTTGSVLADTIAADGDAVAAGVQSVVELGDVRPGTVMTVPVTFVLACRGSSRVARGATVTLSLAGAVVPAGGDVGATDGSVTAPPDWPTDADPCGFPAETAAGSAPSLVTISAPAVPGGPYTYSLMFDPVPGGGGAAAISGFAFVTFRLTVVDNTPPTLLLPADFAVEGTTRGGATPLWTVSAVDAEDDPPPVPACDRVPGGFVALGTIVVTCSVTDGGGLRATGAFEVTVVDTTPPTLGGLPGSILVATGTAGGRVVDYPAATAVDIVDPGVVPACLPASGAIFPIGDTTVTCSATDASGNTSTGTFAVRVDRLMALFDEPIGAGAVLRMNGARRVPVKVRIYRNGIAQRAGPVTMTVSRCGLAAATPVGALSWQPEADRWSGHVDAVTLPSGGCRRVAVHLGADAAGWFDLVEVDGSGPGVAAARLRR